jgi:hypothetical protein
MSQACGATPDAGLAYFAEHAYCCAKRSGDTIRRDIAESRPGASLTDLGSQICFHSKPRGPASQTASQSVRRPAIIWVHARTSFTPANALSGVAEITDTEEVTGSNPVSPTSITPGQSQIPGSQTVPGAGPETVAYLTAYLSPRLLMREKGVHRARTAGEHRPQLLAVHQLGDAAAGVANQVGDVFDTHPGAR